MQIFKKQTKYLYIFKWVIYIHCTHRHKHSDNIQQKYTHEYKITYYCYTSLFSFIGVSCVSARWTAAVSRCAKIESATMSFERALTRSHALARLRYRKMKMSDLTSYLYVHSWWSEWASHWQLICIKPFKHVNTKLQIQNNESMQMLLLLLFA